jgi:hypothetical protein
MVDMFMAFVVVYKFAEAISKDGPEGALPASEAEGLDKTNNADNMKITECG